MNSVPASLAISIGILVLAVTAGRWWLVRDTLVHRLINRALTWEICGMTLWMTAAWWGTPEFGARIFAAAGLMSGASILGIAGQFRGVDPVEGARRQRGYDLVGLVIGGIVVAGTPALDRALSIDLLSAAWIACLVPLVQASLWIGRACVRELRSRSTALPQRLAYGALLLTAVYWIVSSIAAVVRTLAGVTPEDPGQAWILMAFAGLAVITALVAIPLIVALLARAGWDRTGRQVRRLRPLWRDLTAAVPEVVMHTGGRYPEQRLYRMIVEIRDALLHLRPYAAEGEFRPIESYARQIAAATLERTLSDRPVRPAPSAGETLAFPDWAAELNHLLELAAVWPGVRAETLSAR